MAQAFFEWLTIFMLVLGLACFILLNFACYYYPTRYVIRAAGREDLPMRFYVRGFLGTLICGVVAAGVVQGLIMFVQNAYRVPL